MYRKKKRMKDESWIISYYDITLSNAYSNTSEYFLYMYLSLIPGAGRKGRICRRVYLLDISCICSHVQSGQPQQEKRHYQRYFFTRLADTADLHGDGDIVRTASSEETVASHMFHLQQWQDSGH